MLSRTALALLTLCGFMAGCQKADERTELEANATQAVRAHLRDKDAKLTFYFATVGPEEGERRACGQTDKGTEWLYIKQAGKDAIVETPRDDVWARDILLCRNQDLLKKRHDFDTAGVAS